MDTLRAPLGYRPPLPLVIVAVLLAFSFGCSQEEVPPTRPPVHVLASQRIAYVDGIAGAIHLFDPATSQVTDLPEAGTNAQDPAISPDGTRIAFARFWTSAPQHILTIAVDGTDVRTCTSDTASSDIRPHWSPDGQRIAFTRTPRQTYQWDIYTVRADGTDLRRVTTDGKSWLLDWSPDGTRLLVLRADTLTENVIYHYPIATLATMAPDGTNTQVLYQEHGGWFSGGDYSADGSRILLADLAIPPHLLIMNADGSNPHTLPDSTSLVSLDRCSWSPNGSALIFSGLPDYFNDPWYRLWILRLGDTRSEPLYSDSTNYLYPDWGPKP